MREAERGEVSVLLRKVCQSVNDSGQLRKRKEQKGLRTEVLRNTPMLLRQRLLVRSMHGETKHRTGITTAVITSTLLTRF